MKDQYSSQNMVLDISEHETKFYYEKLLKFGSFEKGINKFSMPLQQILKKQREEKCTQIIIPRWTIFSV